MTSQPPVKTWGDAYNEKQGYSQTPPVSQAPAVDQSYNPTQTWGDKFRATNPIAKAPEPALPAIDRSSIWFDPQKLISLWTEVQASPDAYAPELTTTLKSALQYYQQQNEGKNWWEWQSITDDNPMAMVFSALPLPEIAGLSEIKPAVQATTPETAIPSILNLTPEQKAQFNLLYDQQGGIMGLTAEEWDALPAWQQVAAGFLSQPGWIQGLGQALPWAVIGAGVGAVGGFAAGGIGAIPGAIAGSVAAPLAVAGGLGIAADPGTYQKMRDAGLPEWMVQAAEKVGAGAVNVFNMPAEAMEQGVGTAYLLGEAALDTPEASWDLITAMLTGNDLAKADAALKAAGFNEMLKDIPAVLEASRFTYEALETQYPLAGNIGGKLAEAWTKVTGAYDEEFQKAEKGQTLILGVEKPVELETYGEDLLQLVLADIKANPNKSGRAIVDEYKQALGFSAQAADMLYQSVLDPLNVVPGIERKVLEGYAKVTGNVALEAAAKEGRGGAVDAIRNYYGPMLRANLDGAPMPKDMTKFQLKIADLTPTGERVSLQPHEGQKAWFGGLFELKPEAKAKTVQNMAFENMQLLQEGATTKDTIYANWKAWAGDNTTAANAISRLTGLADFRLLRDVASDFVNTKLADIMNAWDVGSKNGYRDVIYKLAGDLDVDPMQLLADMKAKDARSVLADLQARSAGNPDALTGLDAPAITKLVDYFKKAPLTEAELKTISMNAFMDMATDWAIKAYGVKAPGKIVRTASALKAVQSAMVLGLNLKYAITNIVNNPVTRLSEGVMGFGGEGAYRTFVKDKFGGVEMGIAKGKGIAGDLGGNEPGAISQAMRAVDEKGRPDTLQRVQDAAGALGRAMPVTKLASAVETRDRVSATYYALKQTWSSLWNNATMPKMPRQLNASLAGIDPKLPDLMRTVFATANSVADIDLPNVMAKLNDKFTQQRIENYYTELFRNIGMEENLGTSMMETLGLSDHINDRIKRGMSMAEALNDVRKVAYKASDAKLKADLATRSAEAATKVQASGWSEAYRMFADLMHQRDEQINRHTSLMTDTWELSDRLKAGKNRDMANAMWDQVNATTRHDWKQLQDWESSTWKGMLEGLGFTKGDKLTLEADAVLRPIATNHDTWSSFFEARDALWKAYANNPGRTLADRAILLEQLAKMYDDASSAEIANLTDVGDTFVKMWQAQGLNGVDSARKWWADVVRINKKRQDLMKDMRDYDRGVEPDQLRTPEVKALVSGDYTQRGKRVRWPKFYKEVLLPLYSEYNKTDLDGMTDMMNASRGPVNPQPVQPANMPPPSTATPDMTPRIAFWNSGTSGLQLLIGNEWFNSTRLMNGGDKKSVFHFVKGKTAEADWDTVNAMQDAYGRVFWVRKGYDMNKAGQPNPLQPNPSQQQPQTKVMGDVVPATIDTVAGVQHKSQIEADGWSNYVEPLLIELEALASEPGKYAFDATKIDAATMNTIRDYIATVQTDYSKRKRATMDIAANRVEMSLLNYSNQYNFDTALNVVFPYQFWYTRSMMNWASRMVDKPAWFSMYYRLISNFSTDDEDSLMPYRMRGTIRVPVPFLPKEMGGAIYIDPWGKFFPFHEFGRPIDNIMQNNNRQTRKAESILYDMLKEEQITQDELSAAVEGRTGKLWEQAMMLAKEDEGQDMMDMVGLTMSPAMYLTMPYKLLTGKADEVTELPFTRFLQGLTGATGMDWTQLDVVGKQMRGAGIEEFGEWGKYYIERQLTNMVMDGKIDTNTAIEAMIEGKGDAWDAARQLVMQEVAMKEPGMMAIIAGKESGLSAVLGATLLSWLPAKLLPTGELESRGLQKEYKKAWEDYEQGDVEAVNRFFDEHPEYKARTALYEDDPAVRLHKYLENEVSERYYDLPKAFQEKAREAMGDDFISAFVDKETRDPEGVPVETLSQWSKMLGGYAIAGTEGMPIEYGSEATTKAYTGYLEEMDKLFPQLASIDKWLYSIPEAQRQAVYDSAIYKEREAWQNQYASNHPDIIPLIISQNSRLKGADPKVQTQVYLYYSEMNRLFGNIDDTWTGYFALPKGKERRTYWNSHPELQQYSDWKKEILTEMPAIEPYIGKQDEGVMADDFSDAYKQKYQKPPIDLKSVPQSLVTSLYDFYSAGVELTSGDHSYLRMLWESGGRPTGSFVAWLESIRYMFVK